jgi:hypothetical protein
VIATVAVVAAVAAVAVVAAIAAVAVVPAVPAIKIHHQRIILFKKVALGAKFYFRKLIA